MTEVRRFGIRCAGLARALRRLRGLIPFCPVAGGLFEFCTLRGRHSLHELLRALAEHLGLRPIDLPGGVLLSEAIELIDQALGQLAAGLGSLRRLTAGLSFGRIRISGLRLAIGWLRLILGCTLRRSVTRLLLGSTICRRRLLRRTG